MSALVIQQMDAKPSPDIKALWKSAFVQDPDDYIDGFLSRLPKSTILLTGTIEGRLATMLFLLPAEVRFRGQQLPVRYLYAGCTHPQYRGQGFYRSLMSAAADAVREKEECAIYLHPADDRLFDTYRRLGYRDGIYGSQKATTGDQIHPSACVDAYMLSREQAMDTLSQHVVIWNTDAVITRFFIDDALARGALMMNGKDGVALLHKHAILEKFFIHDTTCDRQRCLWLPIGDTPLSAWMNETHGFTGLIGE